MFKILLTYLLIFSPIADSSVFAQVEIQNNESKQAEEVLKEKFPSYIAKELEKTETESDSRFYEEFFKMLLYLGLIIIFLLIVVWFLKKAQGARTSQLNQTSAIKILDSRTLTTKTNIYVLSIYDKIIMIADSVNGVSVLSETSLYKSEKNFDKLMQDKNKR